MPEDKIFTGIDWGTTDKPVVCLVKCEKGELRLVDFYDIDNNRKVEKIYQHITKYQKKNANEKDNS